MLPCQAGTWRLEPANGWILATSPRSNGNEKDSHHPGHRSHSGYCRGLGLSELFSPAEEPEVEREEHSVECGTLASRVNATGTILVEKQTTLSFKSPG